MPHIKIAQMEKDIERLIEEYITFEGVLKN
jgi:hypothetical protein